MIRVTVLSALVVGSALSIALAGYQGAQQERKTVQMQTLNVRDILYVVKGGGGNTMALMRDEGAVLIDTKLPGWGQPIRDSVAAVSDKPVGTIINTNASPDRVGGNPEFLAGVTQIIAHERHQGEHARRWTCPSRGRIPGSPGGGSAEQDVHRQDVTPRRWASIAWTCTTSGPATRTATSSWSFPEKRVAILGDLFPAKEAPVIDTANGGSAVAFPADARQGRRGDQRRSARDDRPRHTVGNAWPAGIVGLADLRQPADHDVE